MRELSDRVGLGWRPELAASIFASLDRIDVVEVLADDWLAASVRDVRALRLLASAVPVILHGTSLGLASCEPVDTRRLDRMARLVAAVRPLAWSEHLAFVRADGVEIGHLAAPPRTEATIEGLRRNVDRARAIVGGVPILENVATLIDPPCSEMSEAEFVRAAILECETSLLLDLHNLHANATNFSYEIDLFDDLPIGYVHLAGGRLVRSRILDDHLHATPPAVFTLLGELASRRPELTVIVERDGRYPPFAELLAELDRVREVMGAPAAGRQSADGPSADRSGRRAGGPTTAGQRPALPFLARLYVDSAVRERFLADPIGEACRAGLDPATAAQLAQIDREGLDLAAESFARKRSAAR